MRMASWCLPLPAGCCCSPITGRPTSTGLSSLWNKQGQLLPTFRGAPVRSILRPRKASNGSIQYTSCRANIVGLYIRSFGGDLWWTAVLFGYINQVGKQATPILVMPSLYLHSRSELAHRNCVLCVLSRSPLLEVKRYDVHKSALRLTKLRTWVTRKLVMIWRSNDRNEYQEYFLVGNGGRCLGLTPLPPSCADCLEIWESQTRGTLTACPGL